MNTAASLIRDFVIDGMSCDHCVAQVASALRGVPGVNVSHIAVGSARILVPDVATGNAALAAIGQAGYTARAEVPLPAKAGGCCGSGRASCRCE